MRVGRVRAVLGALSVGAVVVTADDLAAQLQRRLPPEKLLVLPLAVTEAGDSAFSVEVTNRVRDRLATVAKFRITVIPKAQINEALQASGFPADAILDLNTAHQLARFLSANALSVGELTRRDGARQLEFRLLDVNRSGASGAVYVRARDGEEIGKIAEAAADSIDVILRSAAQVRDCEEARGRGRFDEALKRAGEALRTYPKNGSGYLCMATVYEAQRKQDSLRVTLERAVEADPSNAAAWDRLARLYQQAGDTLKAAHAFRARLEFRPLDQQLRVGVAALYAQVGLLDSSISVLDRGLIYNPTDLAVLQVKERICTEAGRWDCILATLDQVSQIDTTQVDTVFFAKTIGAAQQSGNVAEQARWAGRATQRYPERAAYWKALGEAYQKLEKSDSALAAFQNAYRLDPTDVNSALTVANARLDAKQVDSTTWGILEMAAQRGTDQEKRTAALLMVKYGSELTQRQDWSGARTVLERALNVDPQSPVRPQAAFQLGIGYFQTLNTSYQAAAKEKKYSCEQVAEWSRWLTTGKAYLIEGAATSRNAANQFLGYYQQYEGLIPQVSKILKCS